MANYIDISLTINAELPTWPGDPPLTLERVASLAAGDDVNISRLDAAVHLGTHIDAPLHLLQHGAAVDQIALDQLIGPCQVVELAGQGPISAAELEQAGIARATQRLLLKTSNSRFWEATPLRFHEDFRALSLEAASWIVAHGVRLVGIDYLSIEPYLAAAGYPVHVLLLQAEIVVVEGLRLGHVQPGLYQLICLPLKLGGSDGAPARAVLAPLA